MKKILGEVIKNKIFIYIMCITLVGLAGFVVVKSFNKKEVVSTKKCVITFDTNGGTNISSTEIDCGQKVQKPEIQPEKDGFEFIGWTYNDEIYEFDKEINEDIILVASYEKKEGTEVVTITFNSNGGTPIKPIEIVSGTILKNKPFNPTKSGYEFIGWYFDDSLFDFSKKIDDNITLLAQWKKVVTEPVNNKNNNNDSNKDDHNVEETRINNTSDYSFKNASTYKETQYVTKKLPYNNWFFGHELWKYDNSKYEITYVTSNSKISSVDNRGYITFTDYGEASISSCIIDKKTKQELTCAVEYIRIDNEKLDFNLIAGKWYKEGTDCYIEFIKNGETVEMDSKFMDINTFEDTRINNISHASGDNWPEQYFFNIYKIEIISKEKIFIEKDNYKTYLVRYATPEKVKSIELPDEIKLSVNESKEFWAVACPWYATNLNLIWKNSDESIVHLGGSRTAWDGTGGPKNNCPGYYGVVEAKKSGTAYITVSTGDGSVSKKMKVIVISNDVKVESVLLNKQSLNIYKGSGYDLTATISPSNATNKNVTWSSSNTSAVTVSTNGKVTAVGVGTSKITVTTQDGNYSATCDVTVEQKPLSATGSIGLITAFSNNTVVSGVEVKINATGGSEKYTYYYIKLYKNGSLIYESTDTTKSSVIISGNKNGSYNAEFIVKDSDGNEYHGTIPTTTIST